MTPDHITPRAKWEATQNLRVLTIERLIWSGIILLFLFVAFLASF